jgi:hypothetical protein
MPTVLQTRYDAANWYWAVAACAPTHAHDHWIDNGGFVSPIDGSHCCGEHDCVVVPLEFVHEVAGGYYSTPITGAAFVTGTRWTANANSIIDALNQGTCDFPGTIASSPSSGAQYL